MNFSNSPITIILIAINVIFSFIGFSNAGLVDKTIFWPYRIKREHQYYRFITSGFLHADWMHLIFNMFTLYFFGRNIEAIFSLYGLGGNISYLLLYFAGMAVADLPSYFKHKDFYGYRALGASGAVSAVIFAAIVFSPWSSIYLYGALKLSAALYAVLFIVYCVYMDKRGTDNVGHNVHLWGAIFGLVFTLILIATLQPQIFSAILEELKKPSLFGRG
ncbi:MAG: rhomboid family intramembrane serine protease [Ferruginibacter sp.]